MIVAMLGMLRMVVEGAGKQKPLFSRISFSTLQFFWRCLFFLFVYGVVDIVGDK